MKVERQLEVKSTTTIDPDINISNFDSLELQDRKEILIRGVVDFDMGIISHPKYGTAHVHGTLPLVLDKGAYRLPSESATERAVKIITDWFNEHNLNLGDSEFQDFMIRAGIASFSVVSTKELSTPLEIGICALNILLYYLDDLEEKTGIGADYDGDFTNTTPIINMIMDILCGKYEKIQDIPELDFPMLEPIMWLALLGYEQASLEVPTFKECNKYFIKEFRKSTQAILLMSAPKVVDLCSEETFMEIRKYDVGFGPSLEMLAINNGVRDIPKSIRRNLIFKRLVDAGAKASGLLNDLLGLQKDLKPEVENPNNIILFKVTRCGVSLSEAVAQVVKRIWDEINDAEFLSAKLIEYYPDNEQVVEYTQCVKRILDGQIHGYDGPIATSRWGYVKLEERWVQREGHP